MMAQVYVTASLGWQTGIVMSYRLATKNGWGEWYTPKDSWAQQTRYVTAPVEESDLKLLSRGYSMVAWGGSLEIIPWQYDESATNTLYFRKLHDHLKRTYGTLFAFIISVLLTRVAGLSWADQVLVTRSWLEAKLKSLIGVL